jgi:hypothetical protein
MAAKFPIPNILSTVVDKIPHKVPSEKNIESQLYAKLNN